ncbi:kelch repeat-containing protein [Leptodontidium sp. 2 PMI_412]|nr:kelch repeat-containing protein [Leptodontidium sp. 2 PMI_412]
MTFKRFYFAFLFSSSILSLTSSLPSLPPRFPWSTLTNITVAPRQEHSTVYLPTDTIAIIGGIIPNSSATPIPFTTTDLVQFYSIADNTWRTVAPLPKPLNHANVAVVDGKMYVFGGLDGGGLEQKELRAVPDSWVYDPDKNTWSSLPPLAEARGMAAVGVYKGKVFLAGGFTLLGMSGTGPHESVTPVSVFDVRTSKWVSEILPENARNIPGPRDHAVSAVIDGKMYVIGGFDHGAPHPTDTVFILDLKNVKDGWTTSTARMPTARGGHSGGIIGKKIYTFGGEKPPNVGTGVYNEAEVYDVECNTWIKLDPMPNPKHSAPGIGLVGKVYMPGGGVRAGAAPVSTFDVFDTRAT